MSNLPHYAGMSRGFIKREIDLNLIFFLDSVIICDTVYTSQANQG